MGKMKNKATQTCACTKERCERAESLMRDCDDGVCSLIDRISKKHKIGAFPASMAILYSAVCLASQNSIGKDVR